jgi:hypothetical protein
VRSAKIAFAYLHGTTNAKGRPLPEQKWSKRLIPIKRKRLQEQFFGVNSAQAARS